MAPKKKTKKKSTKAKKSARKKLKPAKRPRASAKPRVSAKSAAKKGAAKKKTSGKKQARRGKVRSGTAEFLGRSPASRSGEQSGDLQGLSGSETANSESVDELLEEGNAFEADAVAGVEEAESGDPREVRSHEVPEDDVPEEYLDKE
jgi:N utilization substance protein A